MIAPPFVTRSAWASPDGILQICVPGPRSEMK
jgi:hypothetical protein